MYKKAFQKGDILYKVQYVELLTQLRILAMKNQGFVANEMVDKIQIGDLKNKNAVSRVIQILIEKYGGKIEVGESLIKRALNENIYPSEVYKKLGISPEKVYNVLNIMNKSEKRKRIESFLRRTEFLTYLLEISVNGKKVKLDYESETFYVEMQKLENGDAVRVGVLVELAQLYYILGLPRETILRPLNRIINRSNYTYTTGSMAREMKDQISEQLREDKKNLDALEIEM